MLDQFEQQQSRMWFRLRNLQTRTMPQWEVFKRRYPAFKDVDPKRIIFGVKWCELIRGRDIKLLKGEKLDE